ncbi:hypothetical protein ES703_110611 [subsurface metagenome]
MLKKIPANKGIKEEDSLELTCLLGIASGALN